MSDRLRKLREDAEAGALWSRDHEADVLALFVERDALADALRMIADGFGHAPSIARVALKDAGVSNNTKEIK